MAENIFKDKVLPIVALRGSVVFPRVEAVLTFGRPKSKAAVSSAFSGDRLVAIFTQKDARISDPTPEDLYEIGTVGVIQQLMPTDNEITPLSMDALNEIIANIEDHNDNGEKAIIKNKLS